MLKKTQSKSVAKTVSNIPFRKEVSNSKFAKLKVGDLKEKIWDLRHKLNFKKALLFIQRKPFTSFFTALGVLLVLMIAGNLLFSPKASPQQNLNAPVQVQIYKLGSAPQVSFEGKVEKSGVIKIVAQMPGIVSSINVTEGQQVYQGTNILSLSTNYSGGNALALAAQIAQTQYQNTKDTFNEQKDLIQKQRDLADRNKDNAQAVQNIAAASATESANLVNFNQSIINQLNQTLSSIPASNTAAILQTQAQLSQFESANAQLDASVRNLQLQGDGSQPPAELASIQHDITIEQLDIQEKTLEMSLEISRLQYNMALVNQASMYPVSPFAGVVDKVLVHVGDSVSPGDTLANISGTTQHVEIVVNAPQSLAKNVSRVEPSVLQIGDSTVEMLPSYISQDATNGTLYSIIYQLDDKLASRLTDATYVNVNIPIGTGDTSNEVPYIPLDAVVQTQEEAFVYVVGKQNIAQVKQISLGQIQGRFVEVTSGLPPEAQVILNRNVIQGNKVQIAR
jgi:multidrug efflux pump subunit AcrA (membrane-fusion protein)